MSDDNGVGMIWGPATYDAILIQDRSGQMVVRIDQDGRTHFGPGYTSTEMTARIFWEAIGYWIKEHPEVADTKPGELNQHLGNILARIFRDGGQRHQEVGTEEAVKEADLIVAKLHVAADEFETTRQALVKTQASLRLQIENGPLLHSAGSQPYRLTFMEKNWVPEERALRVETELESLRTEVEALNQYHTDSKKTLVDTVSKLSDQIKDLRYQLERAQMLRDSARSQAENFLQQRLKAEAQVEYWEDQEIGMASCCYDNERAAAEVPVLKKRIAELEKELDDYPNDVIE